MSRRQLSDVPTTLSKVGALLLVATSTFACIFEDSNYDFGGRRTEPLEAVDLNDVDDRCIQGGCDQICGQKIGENVVGENCKCLGGRCKQECGEGSTCTCSAGGCEQKCLPQARCACSGGKCKQDCAAGARCTCGGENCTCTGEGCK